MNRISSGLILITSELIRMIFLLKRITSELIRMIFSVNRMSPELIRSTSEVNPISSEVNRITAEVKWMTIEVNCRVWKRERAGGTGNRNTRVGVPVGDARLDQVFASGALEVRLLRLNSCRISFTSSSTPAFGLATLAKAYTSRAC